MTVSPGEHHRGTTLIIDHTKPPRHHLNLTLVNDMYNEYVSKYIHYDFKEGKEGVEVQARFVTSKWKLLFSNILQHLDGKKHATNSKKRPSSSCSITMSYDMDVTIPRYLSEPNIVL